MITSWGLGVIKLSEIIHYNSEVWIKLKYKPDAGEQCALHWSTKLHVDFLTDDKLRWQSADHWVTTADWPHGHCMWTVSVSQLQSAMNWPPSLLGVWRHSLPHSCSPSFLTITPAPVYSYVIVPDKPSVDAPLTPATSQLLFADNILSTTTSPLLSWDETTSHVVNTVCLCHKLHAATQQSVRSGITRRQDNMIGQQVWGGRGWFLDHMSIKHSCSSPPFTLITLRSQPSMSETLRELSARFIRLTVTYRKGMPSHVN